MMDKWNLEGNSCKLFLGLPCQMAFGYYMQWDARAGD